jgi:DNA modification methylase
MGVGHHPATYLVELAERRLRLAAVPPNGLVLDPFAGIGTRLIAVRTCVYPIRTMSPQRSAD